MIGNFSRPNFPLIADALFWLVYRYDPLVELPDDINDEKSRILFLQTVAEMFAVEAGLTLNIEMLYRADSHAVRELLQIVALLDTSTEATPTDIVSLDAHNSEELAHMRFLVEDIVESGTKLSNLLGDEQTFKKERNLAVTFLDSLSSNLVSKSQIEQSIKEQIMSVSKHVTHLERQSANLQQAHSRLQAKMQRKQTNLQSLRKQLEDIPIVQLDEASDALERELTQVSQEYVERIRILSHLDGELQSYEEAREQEKAMVNSALLKLQKQVPAGHFDQSAESRLLSNASSYSSLDGRHERSPRVRSSFSSRTRSSYLHDTHTSDGSHSQSSPGSSTATETTDPNHSTSSSTRAPPRQYRRRSRRQRGSKLRDLHVRSRSSTSPSPQSISDGRE